MSIRKYNVEKIDEVELPKGKKEIQFKYTKKGKNKMISRDEVKQIIEDLSTNARKRNKRIKFMIRGQNPMRWTTIKAFDIMDIDEDDEYYNNTVANDTKFNQYYKIHLTVVTL
jgi:hypothetical protein